MKLWRPRRGGLFALFAGIGTALTVWYAVYRFFVREKIRRWGATDAEDGQPMPGDEFVERPDVVTNRAVTIEAPPEAVWPWVAQMGYRRAGFYSYDALNNGNNPSVNWIVPGLQDLKVGDTIPLAPNMEYPVIGLEPNRSLVLAANVPGFARVSWSILLEPLSAGGTRFISRCRYGYTNGLWSAIMMALEPAQFSFEHKWMRGIKARAEAHPYVETTAPVYHTLPAYQPEAAATQAHVH